MGRSYSTTRAIPNPLTVLAWQSCDHMAPVHEGDLLSSVVEVERVSMLPQGGAIVHLRSRVTAASPETSEDNQVLDWRFAAVCSAADTGRDILHRAGPLSIQDHRSRFR
jgi:acyl dehydratase